jgi:multicomponent Na+:H+ antiporter subunit C
VALNIFTSGIFLIFIAKTSNGMQASSIATALVLTGLVVTLAATALAIMLIRAWYKRKKQ